MLLVVRQTRIHLQDPLSPVQLLPALGRTLLRRWGVMMVMVTGDVIMMRYHAYIARCTTTTKENQDHDCKHVVFTLTCVSSLSSDVFS